MINIEVSTRKCTKPLRDVEVDYEIDNTKCEICENKPCLRACPVDAIYIDPENSLIKINEKCFGCVLCREACPHDAIKIKTKLAEPIRENVPNINSKLCKACGACVSSCKTGAIHLTSSGSEEVHSEIDGNKCVRCGYCFRSCPTDAIKYGEILPRTVSGGRAIAINQKNCIGCMTCTRVCPSRGAINIGKTTKLPYINPSYCARCEECMNACPSSAIKYSSRKKTYESFNKIKSVEIALSIIEKDIKKLSEDIVKIDSIFSDLVTNLSSRGGKNFEINVTGDIVFQLEDIIHSNIDVIAINDLVEYFPLIRKIKVGADVCIGCGACIEICPVNAIWLETPSPIHIEDNCVFCGLCVPTCQVTAIELLEEFFETRDEDIYFFRRNITDLRDGEFNVNRNLCQSCGVCVNQCPVNALSLKNDEIHVNQDLCISCRNCETLCPVNAIKIDINTNNFL